MSSQANTVATDFSSSPTALDALRRQSFLVYRNVIRNEQKALIREAQAIIDGVVAKPEGSRIGSYCFDALKDRAASFLDADESNALFQQVRRGAGNPDVLGEMIEQICRPLIRALVGERPFRRMIAGIFVSEPRMLPHSAVSFHSDGNYDGLDETGLNFWIPMRVCGVDAPSLTVVRADETALRDRLELLPQTSDSAQRFHTTVDWKVVTDADIACVFGDGALETLTFELGDLLVFTPWTIHRTYYSQNMRLGRAAVLLRHSLTGTAWL